MSYQQGGLQYPQLEGGAARPKTVLKNGATRARTLITKKDGSQAYVYRITGFNTKAAGEAAARHARDARSAKRTTPLSAADAQKAFDRYYARTQPIRRGPNKGSPRFASPRGRKAARTYDLGHTGRYTTSAEIYASNPGKWDHPKVDAGPKRRAPMSPAQKAALARGRSALARKRAAPGRKVVVPAPVSVLRKKRNAPRSLVGTSQVGGFWW